MPSPLELPQYKVFASRIINCPRNVVLAGLSGHPATPVIEKELPFVTLLGIEPEKVHY